MRALVHACMTLGERNGLYVMSACPQWNFSDDVISILNCVCTCVWLGGADTKMVGMESVSDMTI